MDDLQIIYLNPDELTPYEKNARKHTQRDIEGIKKSILDVGFLDPIAVWGGRNIIVEGHGRQIAAKELRLDKVPVIRLDQLTDEQRREYTIRHNRSAELSEWDFAQLEEELAQLDIDGIDMGDLDFPDLTPSDEEIDGGEIEDRTENQCAVRIIFENVREWRKVENQLRDFVDGFENVKISVGEYDED